MERTGTVIVFGRLWSKISMKNYKDYRLGNTIAFANRSFDLFARLIGHLILRKTIALAIRSLDLFARLIA